VTRDYRDMLAGAILVVLGGWIAFYAWQTYTIGMWRRIGPGMFPLIVGMGMAAIGLMVALPAAFRRGEHWPRADLRALACVLAALLAFVLVAPRFGMVPAVMALVLVATMAEAGFRPLRSLVLAVALAALAYVIFSLGLGVTLQPFRWPA